MTFEDELLEFQNHWQRAYYRTKENLYDDYAGREEKAEAVQILEQLANADSSVAAYLLGKAWRDGLCAPPWDEEAEKGLRRAAEAGNDQAQYALGKLLLEQSRNDEGIDWLLRSANQGNEYAMYRLGKEALKGEILKEDISWSLTILTDAAERGNPYTQYTLGKLYLLGDDVEQDVGQAQYWMEQAAAQGHRHARYFCDRLDEQRKPSVILAATQLLYHLSNIFREATPPEDATTQGFHIDRKRALELLDKWLAMGHKIDSHADQQYTGPTMSAPW